jgi:hypothetical protein
MYFINRQSFFAADQNKFLSLDFEQKNLTLSAHSGSIIINENRMPLSWSGRLARNFPKHILEDFRLLAWLREKAFLWQKRRQGIE